MQMKKLALLAAMALLLLGVQVPAAAPAPPITPPGQVTPHFPPVAIIQGAWTGTGVQLSVGPGSSGPTTDFEEGLKVYLNITEQHGGLVVGSMEVWYSFPSPAIQLTPVSGYITPQNEIRLTGNAPHLSPTSDNLDGYQFEIVASLSNAGGVKKITGNYWGSRWYGDNIGVFSGTFTVSPGPTE
jgi:hypothetical protein